jgi:hypothetical protein
MMNDNAVYVKHKRRRLLRLIFSLLHGAAAGLLTQGVLLALAAGLAHAHAGWRVG